VDTTTQGQDAESVTHDSGLVALSEAMRALADETRLRILCLLRDQPRYVYDLTERLGISQPLVSHHLKILKVAGLVCCRKDGQLVSYSVRMGTFRRLGLEALWLNGGALALVAQELSQD
jgi:DNA-binding transcriptional ArsR family regulator